jgi:hypothetical protein
LRLRQTWHESSYVLADRTSQPLKLFFSNVLT